MEYVHIILKWTMKVKLADMWAPYLTGPWFKHVQAKFMIHLNPNLIPLKDFFA
jgi:hypothetical protein